MERSTRSTSRRLGVLAAAVVLAAGLAVAASAARFGGDYGPDTCLDGFVWREATATDHACVTPDERRLAAAENALAGARRSPTGGAYGPNTCLSGYVWRVAVAGDLVCVEPPARDRVQRENGAAPARRNDVRIGVVPYRLQTRTCSGGVCRITSDDAARHRLIADRLNVGQARVVLIDATTGRGRQWTVPVRPHSKQPGGYLSFETGQLVCPGRPNVQPNGYFRVQDGSSGRWSSRLYVWIGCKTL